MKTFSGTVTGGSKRATALGYPTVNIPLEDAGVSGIYAGQVLLAGTHYPAAIFADPTRGVLEAHILDFAEDTYGKEIVIELLEKIRESEAFTDDTSLQRAIKTDIASVRKFFTS